MNDITAGGEDAPAGDQHGLRARGPRPGYRPRRRL